MNRSVISSVFMIAAILIVIVGAWIWDEMRMQHHRSYIVMRLSQFGSEIEDSTARNLATIEDVRSVVKNDPKLARMMQEIERSCGPLYWFECAPDHSGLRPIVGSRRPGDRKAVVLFEDGTTEILDPNIVEYPAQEIDFDGKGEE